MAPYANLFALFFILAVPLPAQQVEQGGSKSLFAWPLAARHAPRIGVAVESGEDRVRLDIGTSLPLYSVAQKGSVGVDFFTWSRLRSETNFKFPVEAVDYYFGGWGGWDFGLIDHTRIFSILRLAHISTHLVDGDVRFGQSGFEPFVYSREFIDLQFGAEWRPEDSTLTEQIRCSGGFRWLFHTIPDMIGRFRPFLAAESSWSPPSFPVTLRAGTELGLNTEIESTLEFSARVSLKLADPGENGLLLEAGYLEGGSVYGQYFDRQEEYVWFGFGFGR